MDRLGLSITGSELVDWSWCIPNLSVRYPRFQNHSNTRDGRSQAGTICTVALCNRDKILCSGPQMEKSFPPCMIHILHQYTSSLKSELDTLFELSRVAILNLLGLFYHVMNIGETGGPSRLSTPLGPPRQKYVLLP